MAKLQPDYIKWVATLDASQAEKEFHKLDKANRSLKESMRLFGRVISPTSPFGTVQGRYAAASLQKRYA